MTDAMDLPERESMEFDIVIVGAAVFPYICVRMEVACVWLWEQ